MRSVEKDWLPFTAEIQACQQNVSNWRHLNQPGQPQSYLFRSQKHLCMSLHANSLAQLFSSSPPCGFFALLLHVFEAWLSNMQWSHCSRMEIGFGLVGLSSAYGCLSMRWAVRDTTILLLCMWYEEVSALVSRTMANPVPYFSVNPCATEKKDPFPPKRLFQPIPKYWWKSSCIQADR